MEDKMIKTKTYIGFLLCLLLNTGFAFCFEPVSTSDLLMSYLEHDTDLKNNAINAEKAQLSLDSTKISNGFDVTLSTGNITIRTDKDGTSFSVKPTVKASVPQASNLSVSASSNISYKNDESDINDTKIGVEVDIISTSSLNRKISLMKAERSLKEATRKLRNQAITSEKAFYTELKNLLNSTNSLITMEKSLYTSKLDFEKIKAQGYSTKSSTYRLAEMKVVSGEHDFENSTRSLIHSYTMFYKKCGFEISFDENADFFELVPTDITDIEPIDIRSFNPDLYSEVESALWTHKINSLQRSGNSSFSLKANGGFTYKNSTTNTNTVDAGISSTYEGLSLAAGINMPVEGDMNPTITLSASISPNTFRQNKITKQTKELEEEQELLSIETARSNYETKVVDCEKSLENLQWNQKSDSESYEMYAELEKDLANWYKQGIITESEYISAKINTQSYAVKNIINAIEFIIYNDNIVTMFVEE